MKIQCEECGWAGDDSDVLDRVCELEAHDEPTGEQHGQICPACRQPVWWLPRCPQCGWGCDWVE